MSYVKRYSTIKKGEIKFIGNTLGLSKFANQNSAGTLGSIGAFTSLNNTLQVNNFPLGTTLNYIQNGSSATLLLPASSTILYAELVWGGLYKSSANNISNLVNNPITFNTPLGKYAITSDTLTRQNFQILAGQIAVGFYVRTANVTDLVAKSLGGIYSVESVPALIEAVDEKTSQTNHAGWTLAIVYANENLPFRSLNLWTGGEVVSPNLGVVNITLSGFKTPAEPMPSGKNLSLLKKEMLLLLATNYYLEKMKAHFQIYMDQITRKIIFFAHK